MKAPSINFSTLHPQTHTCTNLQPHPPTCTQAYVMYAQIKSNLYSHTTLSTPALRLLPAHLPKRSSLRIWPSEIPHLHMFVTACLLIKNMKPIRSRLFSVLLIPFSLVHRIIHFRQMLLISSFHCTHCTSSYLSIYWNSLGSLSSVWQCQEARDRECSHF